MNNKIALCGDAKKLKQVEDVLSKFLKKNDISSEIHHVPDSEQFLKEFLLKNDFRLFMVSEKGTITYLLKIYKNFDRQTVLYAHGTLKFPLTQTELTKEMLEIFKSSYVCPFGTYAAKNGKMSRLIQHGDIECIYWEKTKSVFCLCNGETVYEPESQSRILAGLDANYFIKCKKGYIVNFFNIEQISDDYKSLIMKSGAEIPMSRSGQKQLFKSLSLSITGINAFYY